MRQISHFLKENTCLLTRLVHDEGQTFFHFSTSTEKLTFLKTFRIFYCFEKKQILSATTNAKTEQTPNNIGK